MNKSSVQNIDFKEAYRCKAGFLAAYHSLLPQQLLHISLYHLYAVCIMAENNFYLFLFPEYKFVNYTIVKRRRVSFGSGLFFTVQLSPSFLLHQDTHGSTPPSQQLSVVGQVCLHADQKLSSHSAAASQPRL